MLKYQCGIYRKVNALIFLKTILMIDSNAVVQNTFAILKYLFHKVH